MAAETGGPEPNSNSSNLPSLETMVIGVTDNLSPSPVRYCCLCSPFKRVYYFYAITLRRAGYELKADENE